MSSNRSGIVLLLREELLPMMILIVVGWSTKTYAASDVDQKVLEDMMLIAVDRKVMPDVVSLVLKPKGNLTVSGSAACVSRRGGTRVNGTWPVVRLWELEAEALLSAGDVGLIPWVPRGKCRW
ncbi:MAG: hypothetical protein U0792_12740 [Gemmataceae bacterium]